MSIGPAEAEALGGTTCTHGGDYVSDTAPDFAPSLAPGYSSPGIPCYSTGPFVHVYYGYRSSGTNRVATVGPRIREAVSRIDDIFENSASKTGATRHVRWLMSSCKLVISAVPLSPSLVDQELPGPIRADLISRHLMTTSEKALMFTDDGETGCSGIAGIAEWADDERTSSSNQSNLGGMLARVFGWCWSPVGYIDVASEVGAHELSHTLGAVGDSAPNSSYRTGGRSHCTDGVDLMCYDDGGGIPRAVCPDAYPPTLDCNHDDYFNPSPPAGSYLATHWNPAMNRFLASTAPGSFEVPPRPSATVTSPGTSVVAGLVDAAASAAAASDGAGVMEVEFWLGHDLIQTDTSAPYTAQVETMFDGFNGYPNGAVLKLVAVAVDAQGRTGPSTAVTLTIGNPKVRLTSPAAWANLPDAPLAWSAAASAWPGRSVSKVELLDGASVIATDTTAPYAGSVALALGGHNLQARVTDSGGVVRDSPSRTIFVGPTGPDVKLLSPAPTESFTAATGRVQHLEATAVPAPGRTISSVSFTANGSLVGTDTTAPYEVNWTPSVADSYEIKASATDSASDVGISESAFVSAAALPAGLAATITSPTDNAAVSGVVNVAVSVTVPAGWTVDSIDIEVDGQSVDSNLIGSGTEPVDLSAFVGRHVLRAVLMASDHVTFDSGTVASAGTNVVLPGGIAVSAPASGATLTGDVTVSGSVTGLDPTSISPLAVVLGTDDFVLDLAEPGFSGTFSSSLYEDGTTSLHLEDNGFFGIKSPPIAVTLKNAVASMTAPASGATITGKTTITVQATADADVFVEQVRFFVDGTDIGGDTSAPYQLAWSIDGVANGSHTLRADAILTDGRTLTTGSRSVTVKAGLVTRLAGPDRYSTAVAISKASFLPNVPVVYIATGASFPDALAGAPVAGMNKGPLLLVPGTTIPTAVATELTRLKPLKIVVLGGTSVVSDGVKAALIAYVSF